MNGADCCATAAAAAAAAAVAAVAAALSSPAAASAKPDCCEKHDEHDFKYVIRRVISTCRQYDGREARLQLGAHRDDAVHVTLSRS